MNNNTSNNFCKTYIYKFIDCLNLNKQVFGKDYSPEMCKHFRDIIKNCNCDTKKLFNMSLEDIEKKVLDSPSPSYRN